MARHKRSKKQILQIISQYGIHIWAILIIANAALIYTYHFATHAASKDETSLHILDISPSPSPSISISPSPSISQAPAGPVGPSISLSFSVPGIGSDGGVMKPLHTTRNITVFLFAPDVNTANFTVKPLYTIQGKAEFDSNPLSPTYTSFLVPLLDLGSAVVDGNYQIAFRTDQSLRTLIKQNPTDLGGEIFALTAGNATIPIPEQTVLMGDTVPIQGDNIININDYNAFINCYGALNNTNSFCKGNNYGDFNDDGIIDGIDYNILLRSLSALAQEGQSAPIVSTPSITPHKSITPKPTAILKKPKPTQTAKPAATTSAGGGAALGILSFFFLFIVIGVGVFLYFKNETVRTVIQSIIHISPTGTPATPTDEGTEGQPEQPAEEQTPETDTAEEEQPAAPEKTLPSAGGDIVEKDCYVKKKGPDEAGTGVWLTLTDDNGPIDAHYNKNDVSDGFAKVKGTMKKEKGKTYLEVSELTAEE